jgi:DNA (cytosine-5)-methyltransferase 1
MRDYYNEWDPYAAQWLRNLIKAGHLPEGEVDERDIRDIQPDDLAGFRRVHFFAGIGGWADRKSVV